MTTQLDDLSHEVNVAVLAALDEAMRDALVERGVASELAAKAVVLDKDLPEFLPVLQALQEKMQRRAYEFLPEHLAVPDDVRARTAAQLAQSKANIAALEAQG